jgi:hypothetical protein
VLEKETSELGSVNDKDRLDVGEIASAKIPVYTTPSIGSEDQELAMSTSLLVRLEVVVKN